MTTTLVFIYFVIFLAFLFDFINGFHDAANSVATIVATGALKPAWAVVWAAFFNFIAFLFFHLHVATTVSSGLIQPGIIDPYLIFSALLSAVLWNLFTWYFGLPSSSSHALIGGLAGAAVVKAGFETLNLIGFSKVILAIVLSPVLGFLIGLFFMRFLSYLLKNVASKKVTLWAKRSQFVAGALLSLGHGGNDAQKTMGIVAMLLFSTGLLTGNFYIPFWVVISCNFVMGLGTLIGGWRIINTMGKKITTLSPLSGGCAATAAALTLFTATDLGVPISTTHTVTGSIAGVGVHKSLLDTHWETIRRIVWAWVLTMPISALIAGGLMWMQRYF